MAFTTPNMSLTAWDLETDPYDHDQLVNNWAAIDGHDHSEGKGAPLSASAIPILGSDNLEDCAVPTRVICDGAVTLEKMGVCAVKAPNLCDNSVTTSKIADRQVVASKIATGAVTEGKISDGNVTAAKIASGAVLNEKIKDSSVTTNKIAAKAVTNEKYETFSVDSRVIGPAAVGTGHLAKHTVTGDKIAEGVVDISHLAPVPSCGFGKVYNQQIGRSLNNDTNWHSLSWDTTRWDNKSFLNLSDRTQLIMPEYGIYMVEAGVLWEDGYHANTGIKRMRIRLNTTVLGISAPDIAWPLAGGGTTRVGQSLVQTFLGVPGVYIDVQVMHTALSPQNIVSEGNSTHVSVTYLGQWTQLGSVPTGQGN